MKTFRKILSSIVCASMIVSSLSIPAMAATGTLVNPDESIISSTNDADLSIAKIAEPTAVEDQYKITFAMPATIEETEKSVAVAFVLDKSSSGEYGDDYKDAVAEMMTNMQDAAKDPNLSFNVGACVFGYGLLESSDGLLDISNQTNFDKVSDILNKTVGGNGTSVEAGIKEAQGWLDSSTADYKYLINLTDYAGYYLAADDGSVLYGGQDGYTYENKYESYNTWDAETIADLVDNDMLPTVGGSVSGNHFLTVHDDIPTAADQTDPQTPSNWVKSMYWVGKELQEIKDSGVKVISVVQDYHPNGGTLYYSANAFQKWVEKYICAGDAFFDLSAGDSITDAFSKTTATVLYQLGKATLTDEIGECFDYVDGTVAVTVDGVALPATGDATHMVYGTPDVQGVYPYETLYDQSTKTWTWKANVPVKVQTSVKFSFDVALNKEKVDGLVADKHYNLLTNKDAQIVYQQAVYANGGVTYSDKEMTINMASPYVDYEKSEPITPDEDGYIHLNKIWSNPNTSHDPITLNIYKDGTQVDTVTLGEGGIWSTDYKVHTASDAEADTTVATVSNAVEVASYSDADDVEYVDGEVIDDGLSVSDSEGGKYTVTENTVTGYSATYKYDEATHSVTITNTKTTSSSTNSSSSSSSSGSGTTSIRPNVTPLGTTPTVEPLVDPEVPTGIVSLPKTGEESLSVWAAVVSFIVMIGAAIIALKKKNIA